MLLVELEVHPGPWLLQEDLSTLSPSFLAEASFPYLFHSILSTACSSPSQGWWPDPQAPTSALFWSCFSQMWQEGQEIRGQYFLVV